jgi:GT2 family glycosyltransferase
MSRLLENCVLIICTRHRSDFIFTTLQHLKSFQKIPKLLIIVDSSEDEKTKDMIDFFSNELYFQLKYLHSLPGLPHQRNVGIEFLVTNQLLEDSGVVSFLDDDVRVKSDYFQTVSELFDQNPLAIAIGGFVDEVSKVNSKTLFRRLALLGSKNSGVILKSGFAMVPFPNKKIMQTQWIPGGMQNVRFEVFKNELFDGKIRMYGEDVEFYSRINKYGQILCSSHLPVKHLEAVEEKDNSRAVQCFTDGFRWTMASNRRYGVKKYAVLFSTANLVLADAILWIFDSRGCHKESLLGHIDFFSNLIRRNQVQQFVDHPGSGPNP